MSTLFRNKILSGLVILLLIANITTLIMFWMSMKHKPSRPQQQAQDFIVKELSMNAEQQKQYNTMVADHRKQSKEINNQIRSYKDSLFNLLNNETATGTEKNTFATKIASLTQQLDLLTFEHFKEVRKICNPEQQKKFDKIIKDVLRMMAAPAPGRGHGGPGPEGPPPGMEGHPPPPEN